MTARLRRAAGLLAIALAVLALGACGRRGNPVAPQIRVPQAVTDLIAVEREGGIELAWTLPRRRLDQSRLLDPGVARLYRVDDAGTGEPRAAMLTDGRIAGYTEVATFRIQDPPSPSIQRGRVVYVDRGNLSYDRRYTYVVTTADSLGRTSPPSARTSITYIAPPEAPQALRAEPGDRSVRLTWTAPVRLVDGTAVTAPLVYEVLRADERGAPAAPVGRTQPGETTFTDRGLENERAYEYAVRAVRVADAASGTGEPGARVPATPVRATPPAPVTDLVAVPSRGEVRLSWRPSAEPDLAGYVVYRAAPGGAPARVGSVRAPATTFVDRDVAPGPYRYTVRAVDATARANESAPSNEVTVTVP
ncbi:MAG TPA: fibronectin type III domain-containing protein [Methylomirabilota bacterium]|nr:fibronectin type III domain-containing protein [Methylomirabilota bacterium]